MKLTKKYLKELKNKYTDLRDKSRDLYFIETDTKIKNDYYNRYTVNEAKINLLNKLLSEK